jgi:hypothetical protein
MAKTAKKAVMETKTPVAKTPAIVGTAPKSGDQKAAPVGKSGDQKSAPAKKLSETVIKWRAQPKFEPSQKITILSEGNPKRGTAAKRFAFYKNGMTVAQYQEVMAQNEGSARLAMADMRWDFVAGFINIK